MAQMHARGRIGEHLGEECALRFLEAFLVPLGELRLGLQLLPGRKRAKLRGARTSSCRR
jgi:hypothetical protein